MALQLEQLRFDARNLAQTHSPYEGYDAPCSFCGGAWPCPARRVADGALSPPTDILENLPSSIVTPERLDEWKTWMEPEWIIHDPEECSVYPEHTIAWKFSVFVVYRKVTSLQDALAISNEYKWHAYGLWKPTSAASLEIDRTLLSVGLGMCQESVKARRFDDAERYRIIDGKPPPKWEEGS